MRHLIALSLCLLPFFVGVRPAAAQNQHEMNQQAHKDFLKADAELNRVYQRLVAKLDDTSKKKLVDAQLKWIKFRDADAEARAATNQGGTIYPTVYNGVLAQTTKLRTGQLKQWLEEFSEK